MNRMSIYMFIITILIPGLGIPTSITLYTLIYKHYKHMGELLQNFYIIKTGDIFINFILY